MAADTDKKETSDSPLEIVESNKDESEEENISSNEGRGGTGSGSNVHIEFERKNINKPPTRHNTVPALSV